MKTSIKITPKQDDDAGGSSTVLSMHLTPETQKFTIDSNGLYEEQEFDIEEVYQALQILRGIQSND